MSFRYGSGINKPGFNALAAQTTTYTYELYTWGQNTYGQLGLGNTTSYSSPKQVGALTTWLVIAGGRYSTAAIKTDGTLWSWGRNEYGQLGDGTTTNRNSPIQVGALTAWSTISLGTFNSTLAVKTDGTLWSWGNNFRGQLGLGNITYYSSPVQVGALTTWLKVAGGSYFSAAIKTDGTLWTWGLGTSGRLGLGNTSNYSSPKQVGALTTWSKVNCGVNFVIATTTSGTLYAWGNNQFGQLGDGTATSRSSPVQVGALTTWLNIACGSYDTRATTSGGALWTWGRNNYGQLGLSNTSYGVSSPNQVGALTTWSSVTGGVWYTTANKTDGTLWSWGRNNYGQLGLSNTTDYSSPKQIGALTAWLIIASGYATSIALKY